MDDRVKRIKNNVDKLSNKIEEVGKIVEKDYEDLRNLTIEMVTKNAIFTINPTNN
jgi:hypothetical protein